MRSLALQTPVSSVPSRSDPECVVSQFNKICWVLPAGIPTMVQETAQILGQLDAAAVQIMMPVQVALVT